MRITIRWTQVKTELKSLLAHIGLAKLWPGWSVLPRVGGGAWCFVVACFACGSAHAATLAVGTVNGSVGTTLSLPVTLTPGSGQSVAAVQCDIAFPTTLALSSVAAGTTATAAGKTLSSFSLGVGSLRVVIAGFNQTAIAAGTVATLNFAVAGNASGTLSVGLSNAVLASNTGQSVAVTTVNGGVNVSVIAVHSADPNNDGKIALTELLRVIQFYNSGGYACATGTEDNFAPGTGVRTCTPHSADYNPQDWRIGLTEILRVIQFYNAKGYVADATGEDGFKPLF